jgi:hypothetical protein
MGNRLGTNDLADGWTPGAYVERLVIDDTTPGSAPTEAAFYRSLDGTHLHLEIEGDGDGRGVVHTSEGTIVDDVPCQGVLLSVTITPDMARQLRALLNRFIKQQPKEQIDA